MASEVDELEINPFFTELQGKYTDMYERAQECCYILCIPQTQSLNPRLITPGFVECHILRPSPFFKGQYMTTHSSSSKTLKLSDDGQYFTTLQGFSEERSIKVLSEELAYNKDYKQYKILILERPFDPKFEKLPDKDSTNTKQIHTPKITVSECKDFLMNFTEFSQELLRLDDSIDYFNRHYMALPDYLDDAVARLEDISSMALADIIRNLHPPLSSDSRFIEILAGALESYMMDAVYFKVFPVIRQRFSRDDQLLLSKCHKLNKVDPQEIGVKEAFSCPLPMAVVELANLGTLRTPREKLACLKSTADNVTEGITLSIQERNQDFFGNVDQDEGANDLCITSDDLIPILVTIISRAKCCHLPSDLFYIENFMWNSTDKDRDDLGFCLVSFKAALQYMLDTDFSSLRENASASEISLDDLAAVTERRKSFREVTEAQQSSKLQASDQHCGETSQSHSSSSRIQTSNPQQSRLERQLSRISNVLTQTVEGMGGGAGVGTTRHSSSGGRKDGTTLTTRRGDRQLQSIFPDRVQRVTPPDVIPAQEREENKGEELGGFLGALQDDDFDQPFGKQF